MAQNLRSGLPESHDAGTAESGRGGLSCGVPGIGESACAHGKGPAEIAAETARIQQQTTDEWLAEYGYVEGEEKYLSHLTTTLQIIAAQSAYRRKHEQASNPIVRWWYGFMVSCLEHDKRATLAEIEKRRAA